MARTEKQAMQSHIDSVRRFNRFYTKAIGTLQEGLLQTPFSLAEARVLYELAHRERPAAAEIAGELGMDAGYLSRILRGFELKKLLRRKASEVDGRQSLLQLTKAGRKEFAALNSGSERQIASLLESLAPGERQHLVEAMSRVESLLSPERDAASPYVLRPHRPGDMGWIIHRHGMLYAQEYGWDERFEALVARIAADFVDRYDPRRERCWIAERRGESVGSVFLMQYREMPETVAQLRLLLVEPSARGLGIGGRLVRECTLFARSAGYKKIVLWTNSVLDAARHLYQQEGYRLIAEENHHSFGKSLVGQTWELEL